MHPARSASPRTPPQPSKAASTHERGSGRSSPDVVCRACEYYRDPTIGTNRSRHATVDRRKDPDAGTNLPVHETSLGTRQPIQVPEDPLVRKRIACARGLYACDPESSSMTDLLKTLSEVRQALQPLPLGIVAIVSTAFLALPRSSLDILGLAAVAETLRPWAGTAFLLASAGLLLHFVAWVPRRLTTYRAGRLAMESSYVGVILVRPMTKYGAIVHADVEWIVNVPVSHDLYGRKQSVDPDSLEILTAPRCKNCHVELSEQPIWRHVVRLRFLWTCHSCNAVIKHRHSFSYEHAIATKLAKAKLRASR